MLVSKEKGGGQLDVCRAVLCMYVRTYVHMKISIDHSETLANNIVYTAMIHNIMTKHSMDTPSFAFPIQIYQACMFCMVAWNQWFTVGVLLESVTT